MVTMSAMPMLILSMSKRMIIDDHEGNAEEECDYAFDDRDNEEDSFLDKETGDLDDDDTRLW